MLLSTFGHFLCKLPLLPAINTTNDISSRVKDIKGTVDQCSRFLWSQMGEINEQTDKVSMNNDGNVYMKKMYV